jgi:hypothetical protein
MSTCLVARDSQENRILLVIVEHDDQECILTVTAD